MKKILLLIAILLLGACTSDPKPNSNTTTATDTHTEKRDSTEMKALKNALSEYTQATINKDVDKLLSFIYPKAFTIVSKEKMKIMLQKTFNSGKVPTVQNVKHLKIEPIKKYNEGVYSIITSSMDTVIKSPKPDDAKFESYMLKTLQGRLASRGTVTLDKEKHTFNIQHTNKTIALNEDGNWKFIGFKQAEKYISKGIFPKDLIEKLTP